MNTHLVDRRTNVTIPLIIIYITLTLYLLLTRGALIAGLLAILPIGYILLQKPLVLLVVLLVSVYSLDWLSANNAAIPRQVTWIPDLCSMAFLLLLVIRIHKIKPDAVFFLLIFSLLLSLLPFTYASLDLPVYLAGLRNYYKFIPIFFLPLILPEAEYRQLKKYFFYLVLIVALVQLPVTLIQKFVTFRGVHSGDVIGGTLGQNASGLLSQFMFFNIALLVGLYFTGHISPRKFLLFAVIMLIPCTLNETKFTMVFIFAIIAMYLVYKTNISISRKIAIIFAAVILFLLFNQIYTTVQGDIAYKPVLEYITQPEQTVQATWYTKAGTLNRIPQILFAFQNVSEKIYHLFFGVGIGNASDSFFAAGVGFYYNKFPTLGIDGVYLARYLWEWGIFGTIIWVFIFSILFKKSTELRENLYGIWFMGVFAIFIVSFFYNGNILTNVLGYYFWVLAGIVIRETKVNQNLK